MNTGKYSPTPWNVLVRPFVDDANGKTLCIPLSEGETRIFDAYLMAAAPDLLSALEAIQQFLDDPSGSESAESIALGLSRLLPAARAAVAKAKAAHP